MEVNNLMPLIGGLTSIVVVSLVIFFGKLDNSILQKTISNFLTISTYGNETRIYETGKTTENMIMISSADK